jgi:hypothetical protein
MKVDLPVVLPPNDSQKFINYLSARLRDCGQHLVTHWHSWREDQRRDYVAHYEQDIVSEPGFYIGRPIIIVSLYEVPGYDVLCWCMPYLFRDYPASLS